MAVARLERVPVLRTSVGWIEPLATVKVRARIDGQIVERLVHDGSQVAEGDVLFRIDDSEIRAIVARDEAALTRDRAALSRHEADLARAIDLRSRNVATQVQVDQLGHDTKAAAANVAASEATLRASRIRLGYTVVRAPIAGRAGVVRNARGDLVGPAEGPSANLLTLTPMSPLQVSFTLPERDLDLLRAALQHIEPKSSVSVFIGGADRAVATGRLKFLDSSVDPVTGTILVKAQVPNEDHALWPGQYARLEITLDEGIETVTVPVAAVHQDQRGRSTFVIRSDGSVERRMVDASEVLGGRAAVRSGLREGEQVIVEGHTRLSDGTRVMVESRDFPPARTAAAVDTSGQ
ncbi:efflux RND transporter periplasmic adaptor subunit [Methylobacterium iners]|nr:efflux RND transporter periplasmic adaptor subunit [Methylobacterium iners]